MTIKELTETINNYGSEDGAQKLRVKTRTKSLICEKCSKTKI